MARPPSPRRPAVTLAEPLSPAGSDSTGAVVLALDRSGPEARAASFRPGGISLLDRALRTAALAGIRRATIVTAGSPDEWRRGLLAPPAPTLDLSWIQAPPGATDREALSLLPPASGRHLIFRADGIYDVRLISALLNRAPPAILTDRGRISSAGLCLLDAEGIARLTASMAGSDPLPGLLGSLESAPGVCLLEIDDLPTYLPSLRKHHRPICFPVRTEEDARHGLDLLLDGAQKGTLDLPARYLHPPLENGIVRLLCGLDVTPNHVTLFTALLAFLGAFLLVQGRFAGGILCGFVVGVLDGVDGKLARVKLMCTRFGGGFEHLVDGLYEIAWYLALSYHLDRGDTGSEAMWVGVWISLFYLLDRGITGAFRRLARVELFDYAPFDRFFRSIGARRNTNVLILLVGIVAGWPGLALQVVCAWTVVTFAVHLVRAVQHVKVGFPLAPARVR